MLFRYSYIVELIRGAMEEYISDLSIADLLSFAYWGIQRAGISLLAPADGGAAAVPSILISCSSSPNELSIFIRLDRLAAESVKSEPITESLQYSLPFNYMTLVKPTRFAGKIFIT